MSNIKLNKIFKTVCIASDHAGYNIKEAIKTGKRDNIYNLAIQKAKTDIVKNLLQDALIQPYPVNINGRWCYFTNDLPTKPRPGPSQHHVL